MLEIYFVNSTWWDSSSAPRCYYFGYYGLSKLHYYSYIYETRGIFFVEYYEIAGTTLNGYNSLFIIIMFLKG